MQYGIDNQMDYFPIFLASEQSPIAPNSRETRKEKNGGRVSAHTHTQHILNPILFKNAKYTKQFESLEMENQSHPQVIYTYLFAAAKNKSLD
jgi:hypothetical protein